MEPKTQDTDCQKAVRTLADMDTMLADIQAEIETAISALYFDRSGQQTLAALSRVRRTVTLTRRDLQGGES